MNELWNGEPKWPSNLDADEEVAGRAEFAILLGHRNWVAIFNIPERAVRSNCVGCAMGGFFYGALLSFGKEEVLLEERPVEPKTTVCASGWKRETQAHPQAYRCR